MSYLVLMLHTVGIEKDGVHLLRRGIRLKQPDSSELVYGLCRHEPNLVLSSAQDLIMISKGWQVTQHFLSKISVR